jgi:Zn finger protein HypA/HybF involved in hydrogenase expression
LEKCNIDYLTAVFKQLLVMLFTDFVKTALEQFAVMYMHKDKKPFKCSLCGNDMRFIWKTKEAKPMRITTIFADLPLSQMQVQCSVCGKKMFISRPLLGIDRGSCDIPRVRKILGFFGVSFNRMKVWRCVQKVGKAIPPEAYPLSAEKSGKILRIKGSAKLRF